MGRDRELAQLDGARSALLRARGSVVVVSGPAGIGKSRFCTEVADRARAAGARVVAARCWPDGGAPPLWPWQSILADLCGGDAPDLLAGGEGAAAGCADRFARCAAVTERLAAACTPAPACLVVDDVQAADAGALQLMRFVARSLPRFPLLVLLARRSGEPAGRGDEARLLDELEREATTIELGGFDRAETEAFLRGHGVPAVGPELADAVFGPTGGHPLVLRRVARTTRGSGAEPAVEAGVRAAVDHAVGGLDPASRRVLPLAAVLGPTPLVSEVAEVASSDTVSVVDAADDGAAAGLVALADTASGSGRLAFPHELVRAALEDRLSAAERLDAHARAAAVVAAGAAGPEAERLARAARHARSAATRSTGDARRAVSLCEAAAQAMVRDHAYEQADGLFSAAVDLHASARLGQPCALLALQWAQAASLRGQVGTARQRYGVAVARADADRRPGLLAEAALGWGGVRLGEYATPTERAHMLGLYRRALDGLPADDPAYETLRIRIRARLAGEAAFVGGPVEPVSEAVHAARQSGDLRALAEALTLAHHALFTPEHTHGRLALADELVRVASEADLGELSLMGLLWRTIDILHLGAEPCTRALELLRERATALGNEHVLYNVAVVDVLLLVGDGRLAEAEAEALRCHELGERVGHVDRSVYLAAQIAGIRWMQGREAETLAAVDDATTSPALADSEFSVWALAACLAARAGVHRRARVILDRCLPAQLGDLAPSGTWLAGLVALVEAAAALDDRDLAGQAYDLLMPYADLPAVAGLGIVCLGSIERTLGVAASTLGRHDRAVAHLERGAAANERLGNCPLATISRGDLAAALLRRGEAAAGGHAAAEDRARAAALLREAVAEGVGMELTGRVAAWQARLRDLDAAAGSRPAPAPAPDPDPAATPPRPGARPAGPAPGPATGGVSHRRGRRGVIRRDGRRWVVALGERRIRVPDRVGMHYLAVLLTNPGERIPAVTLVAKPTEPGRPERQELIDRQARSAYGARARELAAEVAEAESDNDLHRAERLRVELDTLVDQLAATTGLNGRPRAFADDRERARVAVQKAIRRSIETIADADPGLAELFRRTVSTGVTCTYTPDGRVPVDWSSREPDGSREADDP